MINDYSFDEVYKQILVELNNSGTKSKNRKGATITELFDASFMFESPIDCVAHCRRPSWAYLEDELRWYATGSNKLTDAVKLSSFWNKCTDDDFTVNSNYGKLIFHDKNRRGFTQFSHALNCLENNPQSKKAVMTLYDKENAYISNDNPCTMFLRVRISQRWRLHISVYMRSSDVYYGLPYDVPFFVFVQCMALSRLEAKYPKLSLGTYTHHASSLHKYSSKEKQLKEAIAYRPVSTTSFMIKNSRAKINAIFEKAEDILELHNCQRIGSIDQGFMAAAWKASKKSKCLKKKVGAALTITSNAGERLMNAFHGGVNGAACVTCVRDAETDKYFGDECPSVHAEMRCMIDAYDQGLPKSLFEHVTLYVTHGPCDACLKLCDFVGINKVIYSVPYKTDYSHWPKIDVKQEKQK